MIVDAFRTMAERVRRVGRMQVNEEDGQVTHDPKSLPTTPRLASLGFRGDLHYELLIRLPQL